MIVAAFGCSNPTPPPQPQPPSPPIITAEASVPEAPAEMRFCATIAAPKSTSRAVGSPTSYWKKGQTIRIGFMGTATESQKDFVKKCGMEWDTILGLNFTYPDSGPYDIRWSFNTSLGAYSYIGNYCATLPQSTPSGNIGWGWNLKDATGKYLDGVARHEWGHALGAMHEQCNRNSGICWVPSVIYAKLGGPPNYWDKATVDNNVLRVCGPEYQATAWDRFSIMQYGAPADWICSGVGIAATQFLSALDIVFWGSIYPKPNAPPPPPPPPTSSKSTIPKWQRDTIAKWLSQAVLN